MTKMVPTAGLLDFLSKYAVSLPEESVHIPEWERTVVLRGFSSADRDAFEADSLQRATAKSGNSGKRGAPVQADLTNFRARLVARHIVENGERVLANKQGEHLLGVQPAAVLDRLFTVAQRLSGFTTEDIETLVGNSEATADSDSNTSSPGHSESPSLN